MDKYNAFSQMDTTPNYHLPLWKAGDITSWLVQVNGAMMAIDTALHKLALQTGIDGMPDEAIATLARVEELVNTLHTEVTVMTQDISDIRSQIANYETQLTTVQTDIRTLFTNYTNVDTRIKTLESTIQLTNNEVTKVQNNLDSLESRVGTNEDSIAALDTRVSALENTT